MIGRPAPELGAILVHAKVIIAQRQGKSRYAGAIGGFAIASVGCAVEGVHRQTWFRLAIRIRDADHNGGGDGNVVGFRQGLTIVRPTGSQTDRVDPRGRVRMGRAGNRAGQPIAKIP